MIAVIYGHQTAKINCLIKNTFDRVCHHRTAAAAACMKRFVWREKSDLMAPLDFDLKPNYNLIL